MVYWQTVADHPEGFRGSAAYPDWKALLHDDYDPLPPVEHYTPAIAAGLPPAPPELNIQGCQRG